MAERGDLMKTSFGDMEILLREGPKPRIEYLRFEQFGRPHKHAEFEYFFVTKGLGRIYVDDNVHDVKAGDLVKIPLQSSHWMEPTNNTVLEGILWYHEQPLNVMNEG